MDACPEKRRCRFEMHVIGRDDRHSLDAFLARFFCRQHCVEIRVDALKPKGLP